MKANFARCLAFILREEGGYCDVPGDSGGATKWGVTHFDYDAYRKQHGLPCRPVALLTMAEAEDIYRSRYWNVIRGDELPSPIDEIVMDAAVNMGVGTAARMLRESVGLPAHLTVDVALAADVQRAAKDPGALSRVEARLFAERIARYHRIVEDHPVDAKFLHGWLNRVVALKEATRVKP